MHLVITDVYDPQTGIEGTSISELKAVLPRQSDEVFLLTDGDDVVHRVTFAPWADRDPDRTQLWIGFREYNPAIFGPILPIPPKGDYEL